MRELLIYHIIALTLSVILDRLVGDPYSLPHPVRWIGSFVAFLERKMKKKSIGSGLLLAIVVMITSVIFTGALMFASYKVHPVLGIVVEMILSCYFLAAKNLYDESMKVYRALKADDTEGARKNLSMIVGRDTATLDEERIAKAAVETVAENTGDGVIAPMLYMAIGGSTLGFFYKAVNTMDSMVGYKNDRYLYFGTAAAIFDDIVNYIPARLSAYFMIIATALCGMDFKGAVRIFKRDRYNHASPNSAQTESVMAGALRVQLAGPAYYFGVLHEKKYIGDPIRPVEVDDIARSNKLMYFTSLVGIIIFGVIKFLTTLPFVL